MEEQTVSHHPETPRDELPDAALVQLARGDNPQAFNQLMERYQAMALYLALHLVSHEEIARELVQEAMLQAFLSLDKLRDKTRFRSWFYGVVLNVCRNWQRTQKRESLSLDALTGNRSAILDTPADLLTDPQEIAERHEMQRLLRASVDILTPENKRVALLFYYEDLSLQEIASRLHMTLSAVKNRLLKIRKQLRIHLQTSYPELVGITRSKGRKGLMIHVQLLRVLSQQHRTLVILHDEPGRRILPLRLANWESQPEYSIQMNRSLQHDVKLTEPLTIDLMINVLKATGGKLENVTIEALQDDVLYAVLQIRGMDAVQKVRARLNDALPLTIRTGCPLFVTDEIVERKGIQLAGSQPDEQLEQIIADLSKTAYMSSSQVPSLTRIPRKLDFTRGLQGWSFIAFPRAPEYHNYQLDTKVVHHNKTSLAISSKDAEPLSTASLHHEGFQAGEYRGKRLRMSVYLKAGDVKRLNLTLEVRAVRQVHGKDIPYPLTTTAVPVSGTHDWARYDLVIDVAPEADFINCSFHSLGQGRIWIDEVLFETVDTSVALTESMNLGPKPDEPQNTSFEHQLKHWDIWGSFPQDYARGIDSTAQADDVPCGYLKSAVPNPRGHGILRQTIRARNYEGKYVRLLCNIKTVGVEQKASLYLHVDGRSGNEMREISIQDSTGWTTHSVTLFVPTGTLQLRFGVILYGRGQIWLRNIHLDAVSDLKE